MAAAALILAGQEIDPSLLPTPKKGALTLGPGLRHVPPATILATTAGVLEVDGKKAAAWVVPAAAHGGRYQAAAGDLVVAQVHHSSGGETYHCRLTPHTPHALLGQLAFAGATKKSRPQLRPGDLVYARVARASRWEDTEIECVHPATGKADGLGPLTGGMVFDVSPAFARRLMMGTTKDGTSRGAVVVLDEVAEKLRFEVAVGRNGRIWVDSESVRETAVIGRLLREADANALDADAQRRAVKKALKEL